MGNYMVEDLKFEVNYELWYLSNKIKLIIKTLMDDKKGIDRVTMDVQQGIIDKNFNRNITELWRYREKKRANIHK